MTGTANAPRVYTMTDHSVREWSSFFPPFPGEHRHAPKLIRDVLSGCNDLLGSAARNGQDFALKGADLDEFVVSANHGRGEIEKLAGDFRLPLPYPFRALLPDATDEAIAAVDLRAVDPHSVIPQPIVEPWHGKSAIAHAVRHFAEAISRLPRYEVANAMMDLRADVFLVAQQEVIYAWQFLHYLTYRVALAGSYGDRLRQEAERMVWSWTGEFAGYGAPYPFETKRHLQQFGMVRPEADN